MTPWETMAADAAMFWRRGWMLGTCGNLSIKLNDDPLEMLISASGVDKSQLTETDFLKVGAGLKILAPTQHQPSSEGTVHEVVYRRTPARACYHVHSVFNNLASQMNDKSIDLTGIEMTKGLTGIGLGDKVHLPIVENSRDMQQLGKNVEAGLDKRYPAVLVRLHGVYAWGADLAEARRHIEVVEFLLEYYCRAAGISAVR